MERRQFTMFKLELIKQRSVWYAQASKDLGVHPSPPGCHDKQSPRAFCSRYPANGAHWKGTRRQVLARNGLTYTPRDYSFLLVRQAFVSTPSYRDPVTTKRAG